MYDIVERSQRRSRQLVVAAATILILLIGSIVLLVFGRGGDSNAASPPAATGGGESALPTGAQVTAPPSGAGGSDGEGSTRESVPVPSGVAKVLPEDDVHWLLVPGLPRIPIHRTAGPKAINSWQSVGFDHSPEGAAFAAIHLSQRTTSNPGPPVFRLTIQDQVASGGEEFLAELTSLYETEADLAGVVDDDPIEPAPATVIPAFRVAQYTGDRATVHVAIYSPLGDGEARPNYYDVEVSLVWVDNDWKLVAPPKGDWTSVIKSIDSINGFTALPNEREEKAP